MTIFVDDEKDMPYAPFSNFAQYKFKMDGYYWKTSEHYFQAQKYIGTPFFDVVRNLETPIEVANFVREHPFPIEVEANKYNIMMKGLIQKFRTHEEILHLLLSTGTEDIVGNNLEDEICAGSGQDLLGKTLMEVRAYFQRVMDEDVVALTVEGTLDSVSFQNQLARKELSLQLRQLPEQFFKDVRHFQPQVGCLNRCSFCSQSAGASIWQLTENGLKNMVAALKVASLDVAKNHQVDGHPYISQHMKVLQDGTLSEDFCMPSHGLIGYGRTEHRPGVLFCYLDNDISAYPHINQYVRFAWEDLGVKIRISTVGYSRLNKELNDTHRRLNDTWKEGLAGVRLSLTPYTLGWTTHGEKMGLTSRKSFTQDIQNFLTIYRPAIEYLQPGPRTACVEFRFSPLYETKLEFIDTVINDRHILKMGPFLLFSKGKAQSIPIAEMSIDADKQLQFSEEEIVYYLLEGDAYRDCSLDNYLQQIESGSLLKDVKEVPLYKVQNQDGPYYVTSPSMTNAGFEARHFYPKTEKRPENGYIDSDRTFLNTLIEYKKSVGLPNRRDFYDKATWEDVGAVVERIRQKTMDLKEVQQQKGDHIENVILPLVEGYVKALRGAAYEPSYFFHPQFTIDTGGICNMGQAYYEFKDLVSQPNVPLTPQQERSFGMNGSLGIEGQVWRISVTPHVASDEKVTSGVIGKKNIAATQPTLLIEEHDLGALSGSYSEGPVKKRFQLNLSGVEKVSQQEGRRRKYLIGQL